MNCVISKDKKKVTFAPGELYKDLHKFGLGIHFFDDPMVDLSTSTVYLANKKGVMTYKAYLRLNHIINEYMSAKEFEDGQRDISV